MGYLIRTTEELKALCPVGETFSEYELHHAVNGIYDILPVTLPESLGVFGTAICLVFRQHGEDGDVPWNRIASALAQGRSLYGPVVLCLPSELVHQPPAWGS